MAKSRDKGDASPMKRCRSCEQSKPLAAFHVNRANRDGRSIYCKVCVNEKQKRLYRAGRIAIDDGMGPRSDRRHGQENSHPLTALRSHIEAVEAEVRTLIMHERQQDAYDMRALKETCAERGREIEAFGAAVTEVTNMVKGRDADMDALRDCITTMAIAQQAMVKVVCALLMGRNRLFLGLREEDRDRAGTLNEISEKMARAVEVLARQPRTKE